MEVEDILRGLNNAQRESVTSPAAVLQVLAPPGSGKTKTLTARVAYLIAHRGLKPWNIITCTFTRKAANEMRERIRGMVGEDIAKQIRLGTFHSIAVVYLRQYGQHIGLDRDFGIADSSDSKAILSRIIKRNDFTIQPRQAQGRISAHKAKGKSSEDILRSAKRADAQEFSQVFSEYEAELSASNLLDYDDLLLRCCFLMKTYPQCVSNVQAVLIDEFQDTNITQYELMGLFSQHKQEITIVGDPDQSIYGFRSAEIKNLARLREQCPDTITINLQENYRSSGAILKAAQNIIEQDQSRPQKKLQATHTLGQRPVLRKLPRAAAEAAWLVSEIKRMMALGTSVLHYRDFAILLRSATLSRVIESALGREGIPYRMVGGTRFYDRAEVRLILDYLRVIHSTSNAEALERIINTPPRRIGDATIKSLREEAASRKMALWDIIRQAAQGRNIGVKLNAPAEKGLASFANVILCGQRKLACTDSGSASLLDVVNLIMKKIDLRTYLKQKYDEEFEARWSNVEELLAQATDMSDPERLRIMAEEQALPLIEAVEQRKETWEDPREILSLFLANVALTASAEDKQSEDGAPLSQVTISTIHSAKGLEWPVVFVPGCFEGSIPHSRAEDNDEERRLLYVAMTRAQGMLYLSCPSKNSQREESTISSFLTQPGTSSFFEEHGPSLSLANVCDLAKTLRRSHPDAEAFEAGKKELENVEDNYWPLNGEEPIGEQSRWDYGHELSYGNTESVAYASTYGFSNISTAKQHQNGAPPTNGQHNGFTSVKDRYEELLEEARLKSIDRRADVKTKKSEGDVPLGRKRQIEGQSTLSSFLSKRQQLSTEAAASQASRSENMPTTALRDIPNFQNAPQTECERLSGNHNIPPAYKIRNTALRSAFSSSMSSASPFTQHRIPNATARATNSTIKSDVTPAMLNAGDSENGNKVVPNTFRSANTFHTTSMQSLQQNSQRRSYGVRPSFNGWANRTHK